MSRTTQKITTPKSITIPKQRGRIPDFIIEKWQGLITEIKDIKTLPIGASPDTINWITGRYQDHIELRRGYALLGATRRGAGKVTGLAVGERYDQTQVPFFTTGQKCYYYLTSTDDTAEVGTDMLPAAASGEDISISPYQNIAGSFVYLTSPNSSIYNINVANPGSSTDLQSTTYRGNMTIGQNRSFLWNRKDINNSKDQTGLYLSYIDKATVSQYTQTTKEQLNATNASTQHFTGTLAFRASAPKTTSFYNQIAAPIAAGVAINAIVKGSTTEIGTTGAHGLVAGDCVYFDGISGMTELNNLFGIVYKVVSSTDFIVAIDSSGFTDYTMSGNSYKAEFFSDDRNGLMTSKEGGTGTINYATGAYDVTFIGVPINSKHLYGQYYTEDATTHGIADFSFSGSRTAGQGSIYRQDDGGNIQAVMPFQDVEYVFHQLKTWALTLTSVDTAATNLPYRSDMGLPYFRGAYATDDGVIFLDNSNPAEPRVKILEIMLNSTTTTVVPTSISDVLDLSSFGFAYAVMFRWGDFDILMCQDSKNGVNTSFNSATFIRNRFSGVWDKLDYIASTLANFNGTLISGDWSTQNIFTLFSGFDDDGANIDNHWSSGQYNLGISGLKRFYRMTIEGLIQKTQNIDIYLSFDGGAFTKAYTVQGTGSYVDQGAQTSIGSYTIGSKVIGGGASPVFANPFEVDLNFASDLFEYVQVKFVATDIGFVQINKFSYKDIRYKGRKITPERTVNVT